MKRDLKFFSATMIVVGSIIGSGIFKKIAPMTLQLQSPVLVLLCWLVAGIITLFGGFVYAEIAGHIAQTGGLYHYLRVLYGPGVGFIYGWSCFSIIQSGSIASIAFVFAESLCQLLGVPPLEMNLKSIAIVTILALSSLNHFGIIFGAALENVLTVIKIFGVVALGFASISISSHLQLPTLMQVNGLSGFSIKAFYAALLSAFWAYDGINNIGYIAGEVAQPRKTVPRALICGVVLVIFLYLLINTAFFLSLPLDAILQISKIPNSIFAVEMTKQLLPTLSVIVTALIVLSTLGATNGSILSSARIYYAMAQERLFFLALGKLHSKFKTPSFSLWAQALWASILVLTGSFDELTNRLVFASFFFYGLGALGLFKLRQMDPNYGGFRVWTPIVFIYLIFCISLVIITLLSEPKQLVAALVLILLGFPIYNSVSRRQKVP